MDFIKIKVENILNLSELEFSEQQVAPQSPAALCVGRQCSGTTLDVSSLTATSAFVFHHFSPTRQR